MMPSNPLAVENLVDLQRKGMTLTLEQVSALQRGGKLWKKIQRAAGVGRLSAITLAVFAAISALMAVLDRNSAGGVDKVSAIVCVVLGMLAVNEFRGAGLLRKAEARGAVLLAWNQALLLTFILAYCVYQAYFAPGSTVVASDPQLAELFNDPQARAQVEELLGPGLTSVMTQPQQATRFLYLSIGCGAVLAEALLILYYLTRAKLVRQYIATTPYWAVEVQRASV